MRILRSMSLKWGLAVVYVAACMSLLLVIPAWLRPVFVGAYLLYAAWQYLTWETRYGGVRPLTRWDVPDFDRFREELSRACEAAGLRREPIWAVWPDEEVNAFAVGGRKGLVVFTTALLRGHPPEEVLAIAGHELQHLASRDGLPALLGGTWLSMLGQFSWYMRLAGRSVRRTLAAPVLLLLSLILDLLLTVVGWVAHIFLAKRSRFEEHQADLAGARLTSAGTMIAALERMEVNEPPRARPDTAKWSPAWIVEELHASHPRTPVRVAYLQQAVERGELHA